MPANFSCRIVRGLCCAALASLVAQSAAAQLVEENVVMVWNPGDPTSDAIKDRYDDFHPDVIYFALEDDIGDPGTGIVYSDYPPNSQPNAICSGCPLYCDECSFCPPTEPSECICCSCPSFAVGIHGGTEPTEWLAMDKYYITPGMFETYIRQPLLEFLTDYAWNQLHTEVEPILAIVTTRGIPATISLSFHSKVNHNPACITGSVESALARLDYTEQLNPYYAHVGVPYRTWITTPPTFCNPDGGAHFQGRIFLTSRLDSADGDGDGIFVDDVEDLIERSDNLTINKFAVTLVYDDPVSIGLMGSSARTVGNFLRSRRWCVFLDEGYAFLNGKFSPTDPTCGTLEPSIEGQYSDWRELVHITWGRNHQNLPGVASEPICNDYAKWYWPHPAGLFYSHESYNGIGLRDPTWPYPDNPPNQGSTHGSVLHWIGAGASFTWGRVNGSGGEPPTWAVANLYHFGLSWGEAVWSNMQFFGTHLCPIGDPLARVTVYDPDVIPDGVINNDDLALVMSHNPLGDINDDGVVDQDDVDLVLEVMGRDAFALPPILPVQTWPYQASPSANQCGDLNADIVVTQADLDLVEAWISQCPHAYSGMFDVNHDGFVNDTDRQIILGNFNRCLGDVDGLGCIDLDDHQSVVDFINQWEEVCFPNEPWDPFMDVNCDGCINKSDYAMIERYIQLGYNCPNCPD